MKTTAKYLALALVLGLLSPQLAVARQGTVGLQTLREQVARLESVDRDPATPPEVKELNGTFLAQRRAQLRDALKNRIQALENYLETAASALQAAEAKAVRETIVTLSGELRGLEARDGLGTPTASVAPVEVASLTLPAGGRPRTATRESLPAADISTPAAGPFTGSLGQQKTQTAAAPPTCETELSDSDEVTYTVNKPFGMRDAINASGSLIPAQVDGVIRATLYPSPAEPKDQDYAIVHIIRWEKVEKKYEALRDRWALYQYKKDDDGNLHWQKQTAFKGTRIYGHERVNVLVIHYVDDRLTDLSTWDINYTVSVKKKRPANVENLLTLAGAITKASAAPDDANAYVKAVWGGGLMCIKDIPSDITADAEIITRNTDGEIVQAAKTYSKTYDNEGRYRWDVSIGVPLKEVKEVQYDASEGIVRAKEVNRQNAYGFLNFFFAPVDVKSDDFLNAPHLVLGVPIANKPLDRPIVALGYGIRKFDIKFDFYAGAVFNRVREPRSLDVGESASQGELETDLRSKRVTKFVFGVNFPLRQVKDAISQ